MMTTEFHVHSHLLVGGGAPGQIGPLLASRGSDPALTHAATKPAKLRVVDRTTLLSRGTGIPFERYADHIVCHCRTEREALALRQVLDRRFSECGLVLHPEKTKLVYCKDTNRKRDYGVIQFDFLGYTFRPRLAKWKGGLFGVSYLPAVGPKALKAIRQTIRGWTLQTRSDKALDDLARMFNPYIRGWINYYSHFYKSALYPTLRRIDVFLIRWARRKFKRLRQQPKGARDWLARVVRSSPDLFAHWPLLYGQGRTLGAV
jgi:RNA-directed DNA polymerase